jgi:hypothetical protein
MSAAVDAVERRTIRAVESILNNLDFVQNNVNMQGRQ